MKLLLKFLIMANFVLPFRYDSNSHYILWDDMTYSAIAGSQAVDACFATDIENGVYYHYDDAISKLCKRSITDGSLTASISPGFAIMALFVDVNNRVWCIAYTANKYIYVYNSDLTIYATYTLKTGNALGDKIQWIALTYDSAYAYITGNSNQTISKYAVANLDGGDPEWSKTGLTSVTSVVCVDENDNAYVTGYASGGVRVYKVSSDGTVSWGNIIGSYNACYCREKSRLFVPAYGSNEENRYGRQYNLNGTLIGLTDAVRYFYAFAVGYNADYVYGSTIYAGAVPAVNGIHQYTLEDWVTPQAYNAIATVIDQKHHLFRGDPTGYLHKKFLESVIITNPIYTSSDLQFVFKEQSVWGTAEDDSADKIGIVTDGFGVNSQMNFIDYLSGRAQRYAHSNDISVNQKGRVYETDKFKTPAIKTQLDLFLYGIFQNVIEVSSGDNFKKTFTFPLKQPDFTESAGKYFTVWAKQPVSDVSQKINDSIFGELMLRCSPEDEGILWIDNLGYIARNHTDLASPSGTITYPTISEYFFYDLTKTQVNSTDIVISNFAITVKNNARKIGIDSGKFQTFCLPRYEVEIELQMLYDSLAQTLMGYAKDGTAVNFEFQWGTANNDGYLNISGNAKISQAVNFDRQDLNYVNVKLYCCGIHGTTEPFQIEMINSENRGWV